ncbi:ATP-binding cassette subfamily B protein [Agromyces terreus]|uniref:Fatty acid ABC transporter ATP-binding/permease protein n=1 Tax=Agromyces terreus TaxID=424795 RepID=A0A9X2H026_9MICO|nr:ABC transporter ATP-binding protein [Agromyces terreus]MCP2370686.1 ATP-binding cassette subfamily B protein [Agromyces terreus]
MTAEQRNDVEPETGSISAATQTEIAAEAETAPTPAVQPRRGGGPFGGGAQAPVQKAMNFGPSAKRLIGRLRPEAWPVITVTVLAIIGVVFSVLGPKLLGEGTNIIFEGVVSSALGQQIPDGTSQAEAVEMLRAAGQDDIANMVSAMSGFSVGAGIDFAALGTVLLGVLALYLLASLFMWLQGWVLNGAIQRTVYRLREDVEEKVNRLPLKYFDGMQRGEVLSRVTNDMDNVSQSLQQTMSQMLTSLLTVVGVLVMMFTISPLLALVALVTIPLSAVITVVIAKRSQKMFAAQWKHTGALNARIEETFTGHALVKVFGRQKEVDEAFDEKNDELYTASFGAQFVSGIIMPAMMFVGNLVYVAIAVVGGLMVAGGTMRLGDVQAFIQYSRQFTQPLSQLGSMANLLQSGVASAERIFELLDAEEQDADPQTPASPASVVDGGDAGARLAFEDVSFSYSPEKPLIEHMNLVAEPGSTVAIVGPTGAGKTTLVNLIMRFYDVGSGRITFNGVDIADMTRDDLRSRTGMVLQDTWLFGGTIRENIAYGRPDATEEEILAAAVAAYVDRFVHALPDGYDTVLDDEAGNLSAGEKQLITIARAFLARPSVLILDEATSSVDTRTEVLVQKAMAALRADRTSFVIAHRLSTIRDADVILVMENGSIVEQGSHTDLLAAKGAYYRLYNAQFEAPVDEQV